MLRLPADQVMEPFVVEVLPGHESRIARLLVRVGASAIVRVGMGYLSMTSSIAMVQEVRSWRGVRAVLPAPNEVIVPLSESLVSQPPIRVDMMVKVVRGSMSMVGTVRRVEGDQAWVVFVLLGRPVEQALAIAELSEVAVPEVWQ
jgi:hypothetical protein